MKKFLSIFIAVAMVLSFATMFAASPTNAPVAKAFPTGNDVVLTTSNYQTPYTTWMEANYTPNPDKPMWVPTNLSHGDGQYANPTALHVLNSSGHETYETYKMGRVIYGYITDLDTAQNWTAVLAKYDADADKYYAVDVLKQNAGIKEFSLQTGNVEEDGEYLILAYYGYGIWPGAEVDPANSVCDPEVVYIVYNMKIVKSSINFNTCSPYYTLKGFLTRGNDQTIVTDKARVGIAYPNGDIAAAYWIQPNSSGMFTLTFPAVDPAHPADGPQVGKFYIYVLDEYNGYNAAHNYGEPDTKDMIAYYWYSNIPAIEFTLSTYISPAILYKNKSNQPFLLVLKNQDGDYVTGANFTVTDTNGGAVGYAVHEVSPGFYRFIVNAPNTPDIRFQAHKTLYGNTVDSNTVIVNLRDIGVFNPYVDVNAIYSIDGYGQGPEWVCPIARYVYDKLPCTIGNALEIHVGVYPVKDPANWYLYDVDTSVDGPVTELDDDWYLIEKAGKITASVSVTAWQRANTDCPAWGGEISEEEMATNACCHTYSKTFDICETQSCTVDKVSLENGAQIDDSTIEVGNSADLVLSIGDQNAPSDLECGCNSKIVHIYMTVPDDVYHCKKVSGAFTMNTYGGGTKTVNDIWWNPLGTDPDTGAPGTWGNSDRSKDSLDIAFGNSDPDLRIFDNCSTLTFEGFTPNYVTDTACDYHIVIQVFGQERSYDDCGNLTRTYPMIYESVDDITVTPATTELSATYTIIEGSMDPDSILAGVYPTIDITDPGFTLGDPKWEATFNGTPLEWLGIGYTVSPTDTGYRLTLACPLDDEGTLELHGYVYDTANNCSAMEEVTIDIEVVKPEFTVQIGLSDGSTIDNDGIITEGIPEKIYVTATDPRGVHDFSTDSNWTLVAEANSNDCDLPTSVVCYSTPTGCTDPSPITVTGFSNPNVTDDATFDVYFETYGCADIDVGTFKLVPPTVKVDPEEVPFTIPATATHVTFTVTDAHIPQGGTHGHGAPGVEVTLGTSAVSAGAAGYGWSACAGITGTDGEVNWAFVPPYSGKYTVGTSFESDCELPCGWKAPNGLATIEAKYQAPTPDTEAPVITITAPEDGATVDTDMVKVSGTVTDNVGVTSLYIGSMKVDSAPDGSFSANCKLAEGENTLKVFAFDAAGNKAEKDITVTYKSVKKTVVTVQIGSDVMTVNGQVEQLDTVPVIHEGHTYLPLRAIAEALGAKVDWIAETKGITFTLGDNTVGLQIGNVSAVVNGNVKAIYPPYLQPYGDGSFAATMVPLRVIAEGLGSTVTWDPATRVVTITLVQP